MSECDMFLNFLKSLLALQPSRRYALGPLAGARAEAPQRCIRLAYFTGDYDMVAQASVAIVLS